MAACQSSGSGRRIGLVLPRRRRHHGKPAHTLRSRIHKPWVFQHRLVPQRIYPVVWLRRVEWLLEGRHGNHRSGAWGWSLAGVRCRHNKGMRRPKKAGLRGSRSRSRIVPACAIPVSGGPPSRSRLFLAPPEYYGSGQTCPKQAAGVSAAIPRSDQAVRNWLGSNARARNSRLREERCPGEGGLRRF